MLLTNWEGCKLNLVKSKLDWLEIGSVWKFINGGRNLNGAHDSLVDAKTQTEVVLHPKLSNYIDHNVSTQEITVNYSNTQQNAWGEKMEPVHPVHALWVEVTNENDVTWDVGARPA